MNEQKWILTALSKSSYARILPGNLGEHENPRKQSPQPQMKLRNTFRTNFVLAILVFTSRIPKPTLIAP